MFYTRNQKQGETAELFIQTLYEMAAKCEFGDQKVDHIRDRIVTGLSDKELSRKLQLKSDLNFNTAVQLVKQREIVKLQLMVEWTLQNHSRTMITGAVSVITNMRDDLAPSKGKQCRVGN